MTAALEGGEWSVARHGRTLPPGKTRYPFYRRLGGPQRLSGRAQNPVPTGIRSRIVQPAVSRYNSNILLSANAFVNKYNYVFRDALTQFNSEKLIFLVLLIPAKTF